MLNNSSETGHLVLFLILGGGWFQVFTIENNVCCRIIIYSLYCVEVGSFYAQFWKSFNHKWVLHFVKGLFFSASIERIIWFLCFKLLIWCITLFDLHILKNSFIPEINPNLIMVCELFDVLLNSVCKSFVEHFCIYVHQWYWPIVFFTCVVFVWFWYQDDGSLVESVWKCSLLFKFLKEF